MQFILGILAVLTGALAWLFASAGLRRYRTLPGADWTDSVPSIVVGLVTVLLAGMGILAAKVNRQRADVAATASTAASTSSFSNWTEDPGDAGFRGQIAH